MITPHPPPPSKHLGRSPIHPTTYPGEHLLSRGERGLVFGCSVREGLHSVLPPHADRSRRNSHPCVRFGMLEDLGTLKLKNTDCNSDNKFNSKKSSNHHNNT